MLYGMGILLYIYVIILSAKTRQFLCICCGVYRSVNFCEQTFAKIYRTLSSHLHQKFSYRLAQIRKDDIYGMKITACHMIWGSSISICMLSQTMTVHNICFYIPPFALTRFAQTRRSRAGIFSRLTDAKLQKICLS